MAFCIHRIKSSWSHPVLQFIFWIYTFDWWTLQIQTSLYLLLPCYRLQCQLGSTELTKPTLFIFASFPTGRNPSQATILCLSESFATPVMLWPVSANSFSFSLVFAQSLPDSCTPLCSMTVSFSLFWLKTKSMAIITLPSMKMHLLLALLKWGNYIC